MHLPVGPRPGAGDRARLDRFRLRRGLAPEDAGLRRRAPGRPRTGRGLGWPRATLAAAGAEAFVVPHGRTAGSGPGSRRGRAGGGGGGRPRRPPAPAGRRGRGLGEPRRRPDPGRPAPTTSRLPPSGRSPPPATRRSPMPARARARPWPYRVGLLRRATAAPLWRRWWPRAPAGRRRPRPAGRPATCRAAAGRDHDRVVAPADGGRMGAAAGWPVLVCGSLRGGSCSPAASSGCTGPRTAGPAGNVVPLASAPAAFERSRSPSPSTARSATCSPPGTGPGTRAASTPPAGRSRRPLPPTSTAARPGTRSRAPTPSTRTVRLGAAGLHWGARGPDGRWSWVDLTARPSGDSLLGQHAGMGLATRRRCTWPTRVGCLARLTEGAPGGRSASAWPWPRSTAWPTTGPGCSAAPASSGPSATRAARCVPARAGRPGGGGRRGAWSRPGPGAGHLGRRRVDLDRRGRRAARGPGR